MLSFEAWSAFSNFARRVRTGNRYFLDRESIRLLNLLKENCSGRIHEVKPGSVFWRAQLGNGWRSEQVRQDDGKVIEEFEVPSSLPIDRMKPLPFRAKEGRINPKGIPCLYLSTSSKAAMSETRPWIGAAVTLCQFRTIRELRVIDLSKHHDRSPVYGMRLDERPVSEDEHIDILWTQVDRAFAHPVQTTDDSADYAPTQIIAEMFKAEGYDGVVYKSPFGADAYNLALFDLEAAECTNGQLHEAKALNIEFEPTDNPYFVQPKELD